MAGAQAYNSNSSAVGNAGFQSVSFQSVVTTGGGFGGGSFDIAPEGFIVTALDATKAEGNSGTTAFTFTVTRSENLDSAVSQNWYVFGSGSTPATGTDFAGGVYPSGTVNFAMGETTQTVAINVAGDTTAELDQTFLFSLTNNHPFYGAPAQLITPPAYMAQGTILNDDAVVTTTLGLMAGSSWEEYIPGTPAVTLTEGLGGFATLTIWRNGDISQAGTVDWALTGSGVNPLSAADFPGGVLPSGTVSFAAGEGSVTFNVPWIGDFLAEADEAGLITLSNPSGGAGLDVATATLTIQNDDVPTQYGTAGNNKFTVSPAYPYSLVDISQGGNDAVTGSTLDDIILAGATFTAADKINGGQGFDQLILDGNYAAGVTLGKATLTNVETIVLSGGNNYKLTINDTNVANGASLTIDASALGATNSATVNAAAEKSSTILFLGGAGNDVFTGGAGADAFYGAFGADILTGGKGADLFQYLHVADSPLQTNGGTISVSGDDQIIGFQTSADLIHLGGLLIPSGAQSVITTSTSGFSTSLVNGAGYFGSAGVAVEYAGAGSSVAARIYVDANHDGNLGGGDMLIQVSGVANGSISTANFAF